MSENKMRILVISDSHGRNDDVAGVIEQVGPYRYAHPLWRRRARRRLYPLIGRLSGTYGCRKQRL